MELLSPAEREKLQTKQQYAQMDKLMKKQVASAKELKALYIPNSFNKSMIRLQCRSYPLGVDIILDSQHTGFDTPHTFELEPGTHKVEMQYVKETGEIASKTEDVELVKNKRAVVKLHFKEPKTLAEPIV